MSDNVGISTVEKFDPKNMEVAGRILFLSALELEIHLGEFYPTPPWTTNVSILYWTLGGLIWIDNGKEFYNHHVKSMNTPYSIENEEKSCTVERWNRTMKQIMFKYFIANNTYRYIDVIQDMVDHYNNSKHTSIKMKPVLASIPENESTMM
jgi:hypothetical protein